MTQPNPTQQPRLYPPPPRKRRTPTWLILLVVGVVALCGIGTITAVATSGDQTAKVLERGDRPAPEPAQADTADEPAPEPAPEPEPEPEPELTVAQEQAIGTAESYLSFSGFSRQGLIEQLQYEGYSKKDAEFAVDSLDVNWKEQAVRVAESYLETSHFSRQGLIDQLLYEGFSQAQAEHGADQVGL